MIGHDFQFEQQYSVDEDYGLPNDKNLFSVKLICITLIEQRIE